MPFARLTLSMTQNPEAERLLAADLTQLIATDLGKRHELTSVLVETRDGCQWTIGAARREVAAHLEVCVTAGTNTEAQKRAFLGNAMRRLRRGMPDLSPATYIVIRELPGGDWGYDGETQADRAAESL